MVERLLDHCRVISSFTVKDFLFVLLDQKVQIDIARLLKL
jgi:hypothetical protein